MGLVLNMRWDYGQKKSTLLLALAAGGLLIFVTIGRPVPVLAAPPAEISASSSAVLPADPAGPIPDNISEDTEDPGGQVLELPQAVDTAGLAVDPDAVDDASLDDSFVPPGKQVGTVADYENQADADPALASGGTPPEISGVEPPIIVTVPVYRAVPILIPVPQRVPGIPATSPMLTPPRSSHVIIGGWLRRVH